MKSYIYILSNPLIMIFQTTLLYAPTRSIVVFEQYLTLPKQHVVYYELAHIKTLSADYWITWISLSNIKDLHQSKLIQIPLNSAKNTPC